jgi:hypothetical protein
MQGDTDAEAAVNTGSEWRVRKEDGRMVLGRPRIRGYYVAGLGEKSMDACSIGVGIRRRPAMKAGKFPRSLGSAATREATTR